MSDKNIPDQSTPAPALKQASVLVVDDEKDLVELVAEYITETVQRPIRITKAFHGLEALEVAQNQAFDLIVSDMRMPKIIGAELIKRLRGQEKHRNTPFVLVTAFPEDAASLPTKFNDVYLMSKPVDYEKFTALVRKLLGE